MNSICPKDKINIMIVFFVIFSFLLILVSLFNTKTITSKNMTNIFFPDYMTEYRDLSGQPMNETVITIGLFVMILTILYTVYILYRYKFNHISTLVYLISSVYLFIYGVIVIHFQDPLYTTDDFTFLGCICIIVGVIGIFYKILDALICS
jgi:predicted ferric reductase